MYDEGHFKENSSLFESLVSAAVDVSDKSGGILTSGQRIEATKIYTRLTLSAITLERILPTTFGIWDFSSIAILARSFIETSHRYCYISEIELSEGELEFRRKLYFFHANMEKYRLYSSQPEHEVLESFKVGLPQSKKEIVESEFFFSLPKHMQNKIKSGNTDMHVSDEVISKRCGLIKEQYSFYYRILSNHSHGSPLSTTSQSNIRGRGMKNDAELFYITLTLQILNRYLSHVISTQVALLSLEHECQDSLSLAKEAFIKSEIQQ
ncbi:DUF5677 domain-containing protein [Photobacterium leiognathi]|uniref:DUF5677 domain-containing protein n=1 Tax=Photobacterium leiognathi TaxID=553611 RepID=UPI0029819167|nr:DUF5677 domain-containing protein [Photobacterium leiognathi]